MKAARAEPLDPGRTPSLHETPRNLGTKQTPQRDDGSIPYFGIDPEYIPKEFKYVVLQHPRVIRGYSG